MLPAMRLSTWQWLVVATLFVAFVAFVWPTLYRYDHFRRGAVEMPVRINRINGHGECFVGQRLPGLSEAPSQPSAEFLLRYYRDSLENRKRVAASSGWSWNCYE
jgi:hypothetical protein